ncbi:MAG TPA: hypothetical protein VFP32_00290 [Candidatus Saccharimonadales bacterium]|nr:hypothetical protein [Candidatus Saccharimonadales bacterium]
MGNEDESMLFEMTGSDFNIPQFQECVLEEVPQAVRDQISDEAVRLQEVAQPTLLRRPVLLDFGGHGKTYLLAYHQIKQVEGYETRDKAIYAVDLSENEEVMGYGVSLLDLDDNDQEKDGPPFVQWTSTSQEFAKRGLGVRRLIILNEANKFFFNHLMSSGSFTGDNPAAQLAWERLVRHGMAVKDEDGSYRFIK